MSIILNIYPLLLIGNVVENVVEWRQVERAYVMQP